MRRATALFALLLLVGCASQDVSRPMARQLTNAVAVYEETLIAAGSAAERGALTEEQLARVVEAGLAAQAALEGARAALAAYVAGTGGDPWSAVFAGLDAFQALVRVAVAVGIGDEP